MPVEILMWIEAISKISSTLNDVLNTVKKLRLKWHVKGGDLEKVKKDIEELSEKIGYTKNIGRVLEDYIQYFDGSHLLFTRSDKLTELINSYYTDLSDENSIKYKIYWGIMENAFSDIKEIKSSYINVILRRISYLDVKDSQQITIYVNEFNKDYEKAQTYLRAKNTDEFKKSIEDMSEQSMNLYRIFQDSIKNMTQGLMRV